MGCKTANSSRRQRVNECVWLEAVAVGRQWCVCLCGSGLEWVAGLWPGGSGLRKGQQIALMACILHCVNCVGVTVNKRAWGWGWNWGWNWDLAWQQWSFHLRHANHKALYDKTSLICFQSLDFYLIRLYFQLNHPPVLILFGNFNLFNEAFFKVNIGSELLSLQDNLFYKGSLKSLS